MISRSRCFAGDHVTDEAGTGFVHTAPGHGREDFDLWTENARSLKEQGIDPAIPFTVDADGIFTADAPGFDGRRVITDKGEKGDANQAVIDALVDRRDADRARPPQAPISAFLALQEAGHLPQHAAMVRPHGPRHRRCGRRSAQRALEAIDDTRFVPAAGQNRLRAMIEERPDWVLSRQRAWGVPITVFVDRDDRRGAEGRAAVNERIVAAFEAEGADAWFADGAKERFLRCGRRCPATARRSTDILDVWFDSGSTHAFVLEDSAPTSQWPADLYLEGSDQHRGWFQSSLLESCGTRGRAPYDTVLTHGFVVDEDGAQDVEVARQHGDAAGGDRRSPAPISCGSGWCRPTMPRTCASAPRSSRPTSSPIASSATRCAGCSARWRISTPADAVAESDMPELERLILSRLADLDARSAPAYDAFDFKRITRSARQFHDRRAVGLLFRHPQGRALLRPVVERAAASRAAP